MAYPRDYSHLIFVRGAPREVISEWVRRHQKTVSLTLGGQQIEVLLDQLKTPGAELIFNNGRELFIVIELPELRLMNGIRRWDDHDTIEPS